MARIRSLKPEILTDERTASQESDAWRLFVSMIVLADDFGNLPANANLLAAEAFWALDRRVETRPLLAALEAAELIKLYRVRGQSYVHLCGWDRHQKVDKPGKPHVPGPAEADSSTPCTSKEEPHTRRATDSRDSRETLATDRDRDRDQDLDQEQDREPRARAIPPPPRLLDKVLAMFNAAWRHRYGVEYDPSASDKSQLGRLLTTLPPERIAALPACFSRYVADNSPFVAQEKGHSLAWFLRDDGVNKYRVPVRPVVSAKEARTAAAVARFVNGGNHGGPG
jgi:hypothetical protein